MHLLVRLSAVSRSAFAVSTAAMLAPLMLLASTSPVLAQPAPAPVTTATAAATDITAAVRRAADAYATAFNAGDDKALGDQWTLGAELEEGGTLLKGRAAIVASLKQWRAIHPQSALKIDVTDMQLLGEGVARVQGTLTFTKQAGAEPVVSRFDTLRVLESGTWRIAESRVVPGPRAARAEGVFSSDGTSFERRLTGTPAVPSLGSRAEWVQVLTPLGRDMLLWHSIERTIDGRAEPDTEPVHLRRIR